MFCWRLNARTACVLGNHSSNSLILWILFLPVLSYLAFFFPTLGIKALATHIVADSLPVNYFSAMAWLKALFNCLIVLMKILVSSMFFLPPTLISDDTIFQNPMVQEAIRMGFSFRDIKKTMEEKIQTSGSSYLSLEVLIADLVSAQKDNTQDESSQTSLQKGMDWVFCLFV